MVFETHVVAQGVRDKGLCEFALVYLILSHHRLNFSTHTRATTINLYNNGMVSETSINLTLSTNRTSLVFMTA